MSIHSRVMDVCEDPRHEWLCWYPCKECLRECGKRFRRKATPEEEAAIKNGGQRSDIALPNGKECPCS